MHVSYLHLLLALAELSLAAPGKVLLTNVKTLTLRKNAKTSNRRVSAIPQLKCVGGNAKGQYEVDVMRCKNQGSDYDDENIQWTCTANLPSEFRLGSTDVICEGYSSPSDPFILKGSCGVEYRLLLTPAGEEKYGKPSVLHSFKPNYKIDWTTIGFWTVFLGFAVWIIYSACSVPNPTARARRPRRGGGFGGWGGGGGGGGNDPYDPPPPYPGKPFGGAQEQWRPGFWSGALSGAAAGYMAGNRGGRQQEPPPRNTGWFGGNSGGSNWAGPSNPVSNTRSSSNSGSSVRHESTGFGSTSRR